MSLAFSPWISSPQFLSVWSKLSKWSPGQSCPPSHSPFSQSHQCSLKNANEVTAFLYRKPLNNALFTVRRNSDCYAWGCKLQPGSCSFKSSQVTVQLRLRIAALPCLFLIALRNWSNQTRTPQTHSARSIQFHTHTLPTSCDCNKHLSKARLSSLHWIPQLSPMQRHHCGFSHLPLHTPPPSCSYTFTDTYNIPQNNCLLHLHLYH